MVLQGWRGGGQVTTGPNGEAVTQQGLATPAYLNTTTEGTNFGSNWTSTLNGWIQANGYSGTFYTLRKAPGVGGNALTADDVWFDISWDVDANQAAVLDLHMYNTSTWLTGYTSGTWWHYTGGDGYRGTADTREIRRVDPNNLNSNAYGYKWDKVQKVTSALQDRGFVW
jgi:hypothetical protein